MQMAEAETKQRNRLGKIRVMIVDDSSAIIESLKSILKSHDDIEVVGSAVTVHKREYGKDPHCQYLSEAGR